MRYTFLKDLLKDIQEKRLDTGTILININWEENVLEICNREGMIWHDSAKHALLDLIHNLGLFTIGDIEMTLYHEKLQDSQKHPKAAWAEVESMSQAEIFDYRYAQAKAAQEQSSQQTEKG